MHHVSALSGGIAGGSQGSAKFNKRGSAAVATIYRTFEGSDPDSSGEAVVLDSHGAAEVYVDTLTTVAVYDSNGEFLRSFVAGDSAPCVEVRSSSFEGQEYDDGSGIKPAGLSQPTTLQAVLDLWKAVNGGSDWRLGDGEGNEFSLQDLIVAFLHQNVDVTSPQFGALGNGVSDDLAAFIAADTEATSRGGAVILVPSTSAYYRWSSKFTLGAKNSMLGLGADNSIIQLDLASSGRMIDVADGGAGRFIQGLSFASGSMAATMRVTGPLNLRGVKLDNLGFTSHMQLDVSNTPVTSIGKLYATECVFQLQGSTGSFLGDDGVDYAGAMSVFNRCTFLAPSGQYIGTMFATEGAKLSHCVITSASTANAGQAFKVFTMRASGNLTISDSDITLGDGDDTGDGVLFYNNNTGVVVNEWGNRLAIETRIFNNGAVYFGAYSSLDSSRKALQSAGTNFASGSPADVQSQAHTQITMTRSSGSDFTFDLENATGMDGLWTTVTVVNDSGGMISIVTPGANTMGEAASISTGDSKAWLFRASGATWQQIGSPKGIA